MRVSLSLNVFDVHIARIDVDLDEEHQGEERETVKSAAGSRVVKWLSRVWVRGMTA